MAWARIDDGFHDHPKVDELSLAAVGLWTLSLTWAHRHRRTAIVPGHVSEARVRKIAGKQAESLVRELVIARLWDVEPNLGGWVIHDFADYLPKQRDSSEASEAGKRGAAKRWQTGSKPIANSHDAASKDVADDMAVDSSRASAPAFPSRPVPKEPQNTSSAEADGANGKLTRDTDARFVEFWGVYPKRVGKADALKALAKALARGVALEDVVKGAQRYRDDPKRDPEFTAHPATWLNGRRWEDDTTPQPNRAAQRPQDMFAALSRPRSQP